MPKPRLLNSIPDIAGSSASGEKAATNSILIKEVCMSGRWKMTVCKDLPGRLNKSGYEKLFKCDYSEDANSGDYPEVDRPGQVSRIHKHKCPVCKSAFHGYKARELCRTCNQNQEAEKALCVSKD